MQDRRVASAQAFGSPGLWDEVAVRERAGEHFDSELLTDLACLGGETPVPVLAAARGLDPGGVLEAAVPALEDGLVAHAGDGLRLGHDRVRDALGGTAADRIDRPGGWPRCPNCGCWPPGSIWPPDH